MGRVRAATALAVVLLAGALLRPSAASTPPAEGSVLLTLTPRAGAAAALRGLAHTPTKHRSERVSDQTGVQSSTASGPAGSIAWIAAFSGSAAAWKDRYCSSL